MAPRRYATVNPCFSNRRHCRSQNQTWYRSLGAAIKYSAETSISKLENSSNLKAAWTEMKWRAIRSDRPKDCFSQ
jgi:hypothetical protein